MNNIKKFGFLGLLLLASCSSRMNGVSGRYDHFDADAYWVSGGFENESDARPLEQRRSSSLSSEPSDLALRPLEERYEGNEDRVQLDDDRGIGLSVADYRRAYRQGYRDGSLDGSFYPGLYRPNYGGWGWGIGPGIGWNAPCWSWGGRWNYFSFWNNPWNNPWGPSWGWGGGWNGWGGGWNHFGWGGWNGWGYGGWNGWGYGGWNGWGGGWNHIGWGGWNGWGGSPYVWVHRGPQTWAGPRRDRLNRVHTTTPRSNRWTPWGQTASSHRSVRPTTYADRGGVQSANIGTTRGFRERPSLGSDRNTVPAVNETRRPALSENRYGARVESPSRTRYEYRAPTSVNREPRTTYSTPRSTYSAPRSTYSEPRSTYSAPRSTYSAPRSTNSAPRSTYSAPRSTYSAPRSTYSAPRSTNSAPRSTYSAPRSSSSGSSGSSSGSSGASRSAPSSSGRSGSFSPRR